MGRVIELFPPLSRELLAVLKSLTAADWAKPTICSSWSVKDVGAHLLGGNLGRLWQPASPSSRQPDPELTFDQLVTLINQKNDDWVQAAKRISPEILIELLGLTDRRLYRHFIALDEYQPARAVVVWAGQNQSPNWFDIAREYTEKWLHQQHIRMAVDYPLLTGRKWLFPVLDTFMRALPRTYQGVEADEGAVISVHITGEAGGDWSIRRTRGEWLLDDGLHPGAVSIIQMDQDLAWRLFTKGISPEAAKSGVEIEGDQTLGVIILEMVSIMA